MTSTAIHGNEKRRLWKTDLMQFGFGSFNNVTEMHSSRAHTHTLTHDMKSHKFCMRPDYVAEIKLKEIKW